MSTPERLLDVAETAHQARRAGHTEAEVANAAGVPYHAPKRRPRPDEIIARILHRDPASMHPDDLDWWRAVVSQVLMYADGEH